MKRIMACIATFVISLVALAQEKTTKVDVDLKDTGSAGIPWLWIIGGLVFIIILVALLSGGRDRVIEKRTVIKD